MIVLLAANVPLSRTIKALIVVSDTV